MSQRLSAIWAIARKDWQVLWPLVLITVLSLAAFAFSLSDDVRKALPAQLRQTLSYASFVAFLGVVVLSFGVAQQDPIPGVAQDWLTRPVRRLDLLAAKLGFLLVTVVLPILVLVVGIAVTAAKVQGEEVTWTQVWAMGRAVGRIFLLFPVLLAVAALTKNLVEGMAVAFIVFLIAVMNGFAGMFFPFGVMIDSNVTFSGFSWIVGLAAWWTVALATVAVLALLYGRRKVLAGRIVAGVGVVGFIFVTSYLPWNAALAVQRVATGAGPAPLTVSARPYCVILPEKPALPEHLLTFEHRTPIAVFRVTGAPAGSRVLVDRLLISSDELEYYRSNDTYPRQEAATGPSGDKLVTARLPGISRNLEAHPSRSKADMVLTALAPRPSFDAPLDSKRRDIPGGRGWCEVKVQNKAPQLRCAFDKDRHPVATLEGKPLGCDSCVSQGYNPRAKVASGYWTLPKSFTATTVQIHPYAYHSSVQLKAQIRREDLTDPARRCGADIVQALPRR